MKTSNSNYPFDYCESFERGAIEVGEARLDEDDPWPDGRDSVPYAVALKLFLCYQCGLGKHGKGTLHECLCECHLPFGFNGKRARLKLVFDKDNG